MHRRFILICLLLLPLVVGAVPSAEKFEPQRRLREPVALVADGGFLFVANRCGSISIIQESDREVVGEVDVGRRLADLAAVPGGRHFLAVDEEAHELIVLRFQQKTLKPVHRLAVAHAPVTVRVSEDGTRCFVASLWARQITVVDLRLKEDDGKPQVERTISLPFAPRLQLVLPKTGKLLVADAFAGRLAVIDEKGKVESARTLPAHNIRGLARSADGKEIWLTHQVLHSRAETTRDDILWGNVLTNNLRTLSLEQVVRPDADLLRGSRLHLLGDVGRGAGDPAGLAIAPDGTAIVALAGVQEVAIGKPTDMERLKLGRRPTAVLLTPDGKTAYVANTFADSIAVIDVARRKVLQEISLGPAPEPTPRVHGERLFFDARLSHDAWFSCHSCHSDGHTNGLLNDNRGDDSFGAPKRVLSLRGVKDTGPWAWNGSADSLADQVHKSVRSTMHGTKLSADDLAALTAYLESLPPAPPLLPAPKAEEREAIDRGKKIFADRGCADCHVAPAYTSPKTYDVGFADEVGKKQFNPPSLRGVSQGGPYFHDGRAASLTEVFARFRHQLKDELNEQDLKDLLTFLSSL